MSIMRCDQCERDVDTDEEEMFEIDMDLMIFYCEGCYLDDQDAKSVSGLLRMPTHPHDPL